MSINQYDIVYLCNLAQMKRFMQDGMNSATYDSDDNSQLLQFIRQASAEIVQILQRLPLPYTSSIKFDAVYPVVQDAMLVVGDKADLLAATTITNGDATTIALSDTVYVTSGFYPYWGIRIKGSSTAYWTYTTDWEDAITIAGVWGFVPHYDTAWRDSTRDVPAGDLSSSALSFTFATPAHAGTFSGGDYIKIDSEILLVTDANSTTGVVTVERAQLGTTAAAHTAGAAINLFYQHQLIANCTAEYAAYLYKIKDKVGNTIEQYANGVTVTQGVRREWLDALMNLSRKSYGSVM